MLIMRVEIFMADTSDLDSLKKKINAWLKEKALSLSFCHVLQSSAMSQVTISIFYQSRSSEETPE